MDDVQKRITTALQINKDCLGERSKIKSVLSDVIPNDKMHLNLLLNAYDEGILKLFLGTDVTLELLRFVSLLESNYGIMNTNANWAVSTWCYILGRKDIGEVIEKITNANSNENSGTQPMQVVQNRERYQLGFGVYKAGVDFPAGDIRITVEWKKAGEGYQFFLGVGDDPDIDADKGFADKIYVNVKEGQYINLLTFFIDKYKNVYCEMM